MYVQSAMKSGDYVSVVMLDLKHVLKKRLNAIHHIYLQPGGNRDDRLQVMGQIKELNFIIKLLAANKIAAEIKNHVKESP